MLWPKQSLLKEGSRRLLGAAVWLASLDLLFAEMASAGWVAGKGLFSMLVCKGEGLAGPGRSQCDVFYPHGHGELLKEGMCLLLLIWFS